MQLQLTPEGPWIIFLSHNLLQHAMSGLPKNWGLAPWVYVVLIWTCKKSICKDSLLCVLFGATCIQSASNWQVTFFSNEVITWSLGKLPSATTTWAGINGTWNIRDWSLPSIIVWGPAVTHNKYHLVDVINEVWCSDAFTPKFALRKVFSIARSRLLVGEWLWDNNK